MPSLFQILLKRMAELSANAVKPSDIHRFFVQSE